MSNSKLNRSEKKEAHSYRKSFQRLGWGFYVFDNGVTVAIRRTGESMGQFSVAIASNDEERNRPSVGIACVIGRLRSGHLLPVVIGSLDESSAAADIATTVGSGSAWEALKEYPAK